MSDNTETLSISVPVDLAAELRATAKRTGIPMSRIAAQGVRLRLADIDSGLHDKRLHAEADAYERERNSTTEVR